MSASVFSAVAVAKTRCCSGATTTPWTLGRPGMSWMTRWPSRSKTSERAVTEVSDVQATVDGIDRLVVEARCAPRQLARRRPGSVGGSFPSGGAPATRSASAKQHVHHGARLNRSVGPLAKRTLPAVERDAMLRLRWLLLVAGLLGASVEPSEGSRRGAAVAAGGRAGGRAARRPASHRSLRRGPGAVSGSSWRRSATTRSRCWTSPPASESRAFRA